MDLIDRQTAIDTFLTELTKRERKNLLHTWSTVEVKYFVADMLEKLPSVQPERKKDTIQKFHDYQVEWLLSHCDLEHEPQLEEWVVRFLHDTANCYMMEIDREEGDSE